MTSLVPPLVVLVLGYFTRRLMLSLGVGIVMAALLAKNFALLPSFTLLLEEFINKTEIKAFGSMATFIESWNLLICLFLLMLGVIVSLMRLSGGAYAYKEFIKKRIKDKRSAETASLCLSKCLFLDDYFSALSVGSVMKPITDSFRIPREKLAYLVDSMAAPLAILCPFSSWVAAIIGFLKDNGVNSTLDSSTLILASPLSVYMKILPFILYSILTTFSVWYIVRKRISFGPMKIAEENALKNPPLSDNSNIQSGKISDFFFPIGFLLISIVCFMLLSGGYPKISFITALQNASCAKGLFLGGGLALVVITFFYYFRKSLSIKELAFAYLDGSKMIIGAIIVLLLAWTLGGILKDHLHTGEYLATLIEGKISLNYLPLLLFLTAFVISFCLGSSWGSAAILFPICIPLCIEITALTAPVSITDISLIIPALGAIFSGCVAGDHLSPISDTTIMSSSASACPPIDHVRTQLGYAIPTLVATAFSYLIIGHLSKVSLTLQWVISCLGGALLCIGSYRVLNQLQEKKKSKAPILK